MSPRLPGPFSPPAPKKAPKVKRCPTCETEFSPRKPFQKYCSHRCASRTGRCSVCGVAVDYRATTCIAHHWTPKREARKRPCPTCGKDFIPYHSQLRRAAGKYCSKACYSVVQAERPAFIAVQCDKCHTTFRRTLAAVKRNKHSFCSQRCANEFLSGERHHSYRGGERHRRGPGWEQNRRLCRERDKVCRSCGKTPEENRQALSVDHLIPWRLFTDELVANSLDNLVALCRVCHAKKTGRAEAAYMRGDVLGWLAFLRDVQVDPASLLRFEAYLERVEPAA